MTQSKGSPGGDYDSSWYDDAEVQASIRRNTGNLYRSFANLLIPWALEGKDQYQLDANKRLQEQLPSLLGNMPEKHAGERESIMRVYLVLPSSMPLFAFLKLLYFYTPTIYSGATITFLWRPTKSWLGLSKP